MEDLQGGALALEHRYDIGKPAGTIGFSSIYRGVQHPFGREVTIIVFDLLADSGASEGLVARIRASAEAYARLEHPGVVRAIDVGELQANLPFVVVDRPDGVRLATHFDRVGTMTPVETQILVSRIAEILEAAHEEGVVHGSLAPAWIHVDPDELSDVSIGYWGLGLTVREMRSMESAYMAFDAVCALGPEMFEEDGAPTVEGDVFAMAAIAFRALAGIHPFFDDVSDTTDGLIRLQKEDAPSLEEYGIERDLAEVVARGLARDPDERWPTPAAFAAAMRRAVVGEEEPEEGGAEVDETPGVREVEERRDPYREDRDDLTNAPSPKGGLLAAAVALILITNVGWYLFSPTAADAGGSEEVMTDVLPSGVHIFTEPAGAKIVELREEGERELGEAPLVINPKIRPDEVMELKLSKRGYEDLRVDVRQGDDGQEIVIEMKPSD